MDSTLMKGLVILERTVSADGPVSISALARELSLPKSSVHRSLSTLRDAGYLLFNEDERRYYPSLKIAEMGQTVSSGFPYRRAVRPHLDELAAETSESAHFAFLEGATTVFVATALPQVSMASIIPENFALPWHRTAFGIAAVAALPRDRTAGFLANSEVPEAARQALKDARDTGHAVLPLIEDRGTFEIAIPIRTAWRTVIGAIGISGPATRLKHEDLDRHVAAIARIAAQTFVEAREAARELATKP